MRKISLLRSRQQTGYERQRNRSAPEMNDEEAN